MDTTNRFIQIEGMDGSGKTGIASALRRTLEFHGKKVIMIRMPGGVFDPSIPDEALQSSNDSGERVRQFFFANRKGFDEDSALFLVLAAYRRALKQIVVPALNDGYYVLCDRGCATMGAYHNILLNSNTVPAMTLVGHQEYLREHQFPVALYLDVSFEESIKRMDKRGAVDSTVLDITKKAQFDHVRTSMLKMLDTHHLLYSGRHRFSMDQIAGLDNVEQFINNYVIPSAFPEICQLMGIRTFKEIKLARDKADFEAKQEDAGFRQRLNAQVAEMNATQHAPLIDTLLPKVATDPSAVQQHVNEITEMQVAQHQRHITLGGLATALKADLPFSSFERKE